MCTVTYIPKGEDQFILTSNRDENSQRAAGLPQVHLFETHHTLYPQDPQSGGTWIAVSHTNKVACILNGAFKKHLSQPPYDRSRGLVLLDFFKAGSVDGFITEYDFSGIEPFTLVLYQGKKLVEFRWDGQKGHQLPLNPHKSYIWSSCTLYDQHATERRAQWFSKWLKTNKDPDIHDLLQFHRYGGERDATNGLVMNRQDLVETLSITGVDKRKEFATMYHHDLLQNSLTNRRIDLSQDEIVASH